MQPDFISVGGSQGLAGSAMATIHAKGPHLLRRLQQQISRFELVYTPHSLWPLPRNTHGTQRPLRISILDASFNPPTRAHLGLANSRWSPCTEEGDNGNKSHYDAKLLLLSVKNADKTLKPGDATYLQRLEMMALLLNHIRPDTPSSSLTSSSEVGGSFDANAAIAIIDEPTFVGKSATLLTHLSDRFTATQIEQEVELSFLVGMDTLERLFSPRYYTSEESMISSLRKFFSPPPEGDNSRIVCARRASAPISSSSPSNQPEELPLAQEFINSGRIRIMDMGDELSTYSSTSVRRAVSSLGVVDQDQSGASAWRKLVTKDIADYIVRERLYEGTL